MEDGCIFYGHLVYFTTIRYILWLHVWYIFSGWVACCANKNLATLLCTIVVRWYV
jgi:hypothetical protein